MCCWFNEVVFLGLLYKSTVSLESVRHRLYSLFIKFHISVTHIVFCLALIKPPENCCCCCCLDVFISVKIYLVIFNNGLFMVVFFLCYFQNIKLKIKSYVRALGWKGNNIYMLGHPSIRDYDNIISKLNNIIIKHFLSRLPIIFPFLIIIIISTYITIWCG